MKKYLYLIPIAGLLLWSCQVPEQIKELPDKVGKLETTVHELHSKVSELENEISELKKTVEELQTAKETKKPEPTKGGETQQKLPPVRKK